MKKLRTKQNVYMLGVFFAGLCLFMIALQSFIYFQIGGQLYFLPSFHIWHIFLTTAYLALLLFMLEYYHQKQYWFSFWTGVILAVLTLFYAVIAYHLLVARELERLFKVAYLSVLGAGALHSISLIFSEANKRPWLKKGGIFLVVFQLGIAVLYIWLIKSTDIQLKVILAKIHMWISIAANLVFVFFMMNFLDELKVLKRENGKIIIPKAVNSLMVFTILIMLIPTLMIGGESIGEIAYANRGTERAEMLAKPFEPRTYVSPDKDTLRYRFMKPLDYDPQKKYPLVVCLHHGGGVGTDNFMQIETSDPVQMLSQQGNKEKYPAFLFVPQCPPGSSFGGIPDYPKVDLLVFEAINAFEQEFGIDEKRRYVLGVSLGGYGSWHFICTRPEMFAAAIPICGGGDPKLAQNIVDTPVWAFHGEKDRNVPVRLSRDMIKAAKEAGGDPLYNELAGAGHNIWNQVRNTPGLMDWLFAQKRD
ncbi:peptidase [Fulvivirgaceae bacterium BMA12]|uniref:Peptidase n=1 Tax=Agaribacillus aureus TaxID=3051825 RepID=A0ABT8L0L9_9BACT|nr:peptidase [Fulvivirgaceae bacterium BMA12]